VRLSAAYDAAPMFPFGGDTLCVVFVLNLVTIYYCHWMSFTKQGFPFHCMLALSAIFICASTGTVRPLICPILFATFKMVAFVSFVVFVITSYLNQGVFQCFLCCFCYNFLSKSFFQRFLCCFCYTFLSKSMLFQRLLCCFVIPSYLNLCFFPMFPLLFLLYLPI